MRPLLHHCDGAKADDSTRVEPRLQVVRDGRIPRPEQKVVVDADKRQVPGGGAVVLDGVGDHAALDGRRRPNAAPAIARFGTVRRDGVVGVHGDDASRHERRDHRGQPVLGAADGVQVEMADADGRERVVGEPLGQLTDVVAPHEDGRRERGVRSLAWWWW